MLQLSAAQIEAATKYSYNCPDGGRATQSMWKKLIPDQIGIVKKPEMWCFPQKGRMWSQKKKGG